MKKALGYIRVSKEEEGSISLDYQRTEIERYCRVNKLHLVEVDCDNGISGKSMANRPGVQRVLDMVRGKEIDAVVTFKSDRISRNGRESLQFEELLAKHHVDYLSTTEGVLSGDSVDGEFMSFIRAGLNQRERKLISMRTIMALQRKRERGERIGGQPKFGLRVVNGELVEDSKEKLVRDKVVELKSAGMSTRQITSKVNDDGYTTRKGSQFSQTLICRMLKAS